MLKDELCSDGVRRERKEERKEADHQRSTAASCYLLLLSLAYSRNLHYVRLYM